MVNNNSTTRTSNDTGFLGLLTIAFIVLKLCHVIDWSWWWVLSPVWISRGLDILIGAVVTLRS